MSNKKIDGTGTNDTGGQKSNISKRCQDGKLTVENKRCPNCNHNKMFRGNAMGYNITKCCRCKNETY